MNAKLQHSEKGQAMIFLVFGIIVLLGMTALAVDGGLIFSDRRAAQSAADAAAMAAAYNLLIPEDLDGDSDTDLDDALFAAMQRAADNGFNLDDGVEVGVFSPPVTGVYAGQNNYVQVVITATVSTNFVQVITSEPIRNRVEAVVLAKPGTEFQPPVSPDNDPFAIIALGKTGQNITFTGGGTDATVEAVDGDIWLNSNASSPMDLPSSNNSVGVIAHEYGESPESGSNPHRIYSVSSNQYLDHDKVAPDPVITNQPVMEDPYASIPEPTCSGNGGYDSAAGMYNPGNYGGSGEPAWPTGNSTFRLKPGIYCITGSFNYQGNSALIGDGVVLYFKNGSFSFRGNGALTLTAPTKDNCSNDTCPYAGFVIFAKRTNTNTFDIRGNGAVKVSGLVYVPNGTVSGSGGGNDNDDWIIRGQLVAKVVSSNGHASFMVKHDGAYVYNPDSNPPMMTIVH